MRGLSLRGRSRRIIGASVGALVLSAMLLAGFTQAADASTKHGHRRYHQPSAQKCEWVRDTNVTKHRHHSRHHGRHRRHGHHAHQRGHWVCTPNTTAPKSTTTATNPAKPGSTTTTTKVTTTTTRATTTTTTVAPTTTTTEPPEPETTTTTTVEPFCIGFWVNGVCVYYF